MKSLFFSIVSFVLCAGLSQAPAEWVSFGGSPGARPEITCESQDPSESIVHIVVLGFDRSDTTLGDSTYAVLSVPGEARLMKPGYPELPQISRSLIIPDAAHMAVEIVAADTSMLSIDPVLPAIGTIMRSADPDTVQRIFSDIYRTGGFYPETQATLSSPYIMRDFRSSALTVVPFRHDPVVHRQLK
jgi:hypothetical protein